MDKTRGQRMIVETLEARRMLSSALEPSLPVDVRLDWQAYATPEPPSFLSHSTVRHQAVDGAGHLYLVGSTNIPGWIQGGFDTDFGGGTDGFIVKFDDSGNLLWSTYVGGEGVDSIHRIEVAPDDSIYVLGRSGPNIDDWLTGSATPPVRSAFLIHVSAAGERLSAQWIPGMPEGVVSFSDQSVYTYSQVTAGQPAEPTLQRTLHRTLLSGEIEWSVPVASDGAAIIAVVAHPGGGVYVSLQTIDDDGSAPDRTLLHVAADGETRWQMVFVDAGGSLQYRVAGDGGLYFASNRLVDGLAVEVTSLWRLSPAGEILWQRTVALPGDPQFSHTLRLQHYAPGGVYVLLFDSAKNRTGIALFNDSGAALGGTSFSGVFDTTAAAADGSLIITRRDGQPLVSRFTGVEHVWTSAPLTAPGDQSIWRLSWGTVLLGSGSDIYLVSWAHDSGLVMQNRFVVSKLSETTEPPQLVEGLQAFPATDSIELRWRQSGDAARYEIWRSTTDDLNDAVLLQEVSGTSYIDRSAANGVTSYYWVRAVNNIGHGPFALPVSAIARYAPAAPTNLQATQDLVNQVLLTWEPVEYATGYRVYLYSPYWHDWMPISEVITDTSFTASIHWEGTFSVRAINENVYGPHSEAVIGRVMQVPAAVTGLTASQDLFMRIVLNWKPAAGVERYEIWTGGKVGVTTGTSFEVTWSALIGQHAIDYYVIAVNAAGEAPASVRETGRTYGTPVWPVATASWGRSDGVLLRWGSVPYASSYEIWRSDSLDQSKAVRVAQIAAGVSEYLDTSATPGVQHSYWMRSFGEGGTAGFAGRVTGYVATMPPNLKNVYATTDIPGAIRISWADQWSLSPAKSYEIWRATVNDVALATLFATIPGSSGGVTDITATPGETYYYFVRGKNAIGYSDFGSVSGQAALPRVITIEAPATGGLISINHTSNQKIAYTVAGGTTTVHATGVLGFVIMGSDKAERIHISDGLPPVTIYAGGGNDTIYAGDSNDVIHGGDGDDSIDGGGGDDLIYGGGGNDLISGAGGNDTIYGNFGADTILGGGGNDLIMGGLGRDSIDGGDGNDTLYGGNGMDVIRGGDGDDYIEGKGKADTLYGGAGNDTIIGGAGADLIFGGSGDDVLYASSHVLFRDTINGGTGYDRYEADEDDVLVDVEERIHL